MSSFARICGGSLVFAGAVACGGEARVIVDWARTHQTIVGFGGTMGWIHPHPQKANEVFDLLFTRLGASVLRVQALGGEGGDELSLEPENDNNDPDTFDWSKLPIKTTEARNAAIIQAAQKRGVKTIVAASWSPPAWMKTTGRRAGGGELKPELLDEFAELWAAYVIGMKREFRIEIPFISIQNEPDMEYYYPTCGFVPAFYAKAMVTVAARLKREKLDVRVLGPDTCRIYNMPAYVAETEKLRAAPGEPILTHLYDLSIPYERADRDPERWQKARELARKLKRPLWFMETANYLSYGVEKGSYEEAMIWARKIHSALVDGDCQAVCYWSLYFDKKGEALVYAERNESEKYEITPKFHTSMSYFRHVRPGMVRCEAGSTDKELLVSAFGPAPGVGAPRVIVIINPTDEAKRADVPRSRDEIGSRCETTRTRNCESVPWPRGQPVVLPPQSVTTFVTQPTGEE